MNKKRVALALAAALGVNTLVVTVGNIGGQTTIAHATQASGRATGENLAQFNVTSFETLNTTVTTVDGTKAEVTFNNIDLSSVESIPNVTFTHAKFDERKSIDGDATNVSGTWANNKLTVTGITQPGIYSGTVTINFKDKTQKVFKLTLVKKPVDSLSFDANVDAAKLTISNLKLNNGAETKTLTPDSAKISFGSVSQDLDFTSGQVEIDLTKFGQLSAGQKFVLTVNYGTEYTATSDIVLVNQKEPYIKEAFATNSTGAGAVETLLLNSLKKEANPNLAAVEAKVNERTSVGTVSVEGKELLTYSQTVSGANLLGGADLKVTPNNTKPTSIEVNVENATAGKNALGRGTFDALKDNFVPAAGVDYGLDTTNSTAPIAPGLIGEYKFSINGESATYFNATKDLKPAINKTGMAPDDAAEVLYFDAAGAGKNVAKEITAADIDKTPITVDLGSSLKHGYTSVAVDFTVNDTKDKEAITKANSDVQKSGAKYTVTAVPSVDNLGTVKTSIIVVADTLDAVSTNATFEKTGASTGKVIISGTGLTDNRNDVLNSKLTISGANATLVDAESKDGKLVYDVAFSKDITDSSASWRLTLGGNSFDGTVNLTSGSVESVNAELKFENDTNTSDTFKVTASFADSVINAGDKSFMGINDAVVNVNGIKLTDLSKDKGNGVLSTVSKGKYQGKYAVGVWAVTQPMKSVISTATTSKSSTQVDVVIDATFKAKDDYKNVEKAVIEYRKVGDTNWTKGLDLTTGENSDISTDAQDGKTITKTVTANYETEKEYEFRVVYTYKGVANPIVSNIVKTKISKTTSGNNSNNTITGSGSTTTGTSTGSTTINVTTSNSTLSGTSASIKLPAGFRYDSGKTPVATTFKYKDKDGKVVTETKEQFSNVTVKFNGDNIEVYGLVPGKNYDEITVDYTDNNGRTRSIILRNIQTTATAEVDKYLANVYEVVLSRPADEAGYHFHLDNLKNKKVSLREFLLNMLSEKEFIEKYKSTEEKIEGLYNAIVARSSDEAGKKFWVDEYKKVLAVYGSETTALKAIADRMVNENELKELADKMGVQW